MEGSDSNWSLKCEQPNTDPVVFKDAIKENTTLQKINGCKLTSSNCFFFLLLLFG